MGRVRAPSPKLDGRAARRRERVPVEERAPWPLLHEKLGRLELLERGFELYAYGDGEPTKYALHDWREEGLVDEAGLTRKGQCVRDLLGDLARALGVPFGARDPKFGLRLRDLGVLEHSHALAALELCGPDAPAHRSLPAGWPGLMADAAGITRTGELCLIALRELAECLDVAL